MAEKKKHTIVNAAGEDITVQHEKEKAEGVVHNASDAIAGGERPPVQQAKPVGNAKGLRIGAVILWVLAFAFEILAVLVIAGKINLTAENPTTPMIILLILDLACVIAGAQLWKKANHIDPASEANPTKFWIWNNMGLIVCALAFVPFVIILLTNKNADKKTKMIGAIVAVVALLLGGLLSYDFHPVSAEDKQEALQVFGDEDVYWTRFGKCYHTSDECSSLNQSDQLTKGTVEQAIAANRVRLCSFCAKRDGINTVKTDDEKLNEENADAISEAVEELQQESNEGEEE